MWRSPKRASMRKTIDTPSFDRRCSRIHFSIALGLLAKIEARKPVW
jgi:hypothetical protein